MKKYSSIVIILLLFVSISNAQEFKCEPDSATRVQITKTTNIPNSYTCYIEMKRGWSGKKTGTGMLIHPRVVLTAGHNTAFYLISKSFPFVFSSVRKADMYFGSVSKDSCITKSSVALEKGKTKFFKNGYWLVGRIDRDFSLIILPDSSIYNKVGGHYKIKPISSIEQIGDTINMTGSPGDKKAYQMWTQKSEHFQVEKSKLRYDLYTQVRNSGSPIWIKTNDVFQVVGVHSRKDSGCNASVLINEEVYKQIVEWCSSIGINLEDK